MKNYSTLSLLAFVMLSSSVSPSVSCEKETPAQFRARYKAHAKRLGILEGVDLRTLSNDDLKNTVLPYLRGEQTKELDQEHKATAVKQPPTGDNNNHKHSNTAFSRSQQKQAQAQEIRSQALALGIEKSRCAHMEISELQKEIEQAKAIRAEAERLGIEKGRYLNMELYELQREIQERRQQPRFGKQSRNGKR